MPRIPAQYWRSTDGAGFLSALGYIPEGAWNEPLDDSGHPQLASTGGGFSAYMPKPSWQTGTGVPGNEGRYTPDVSLHAATREGYFTCIAAQDGSCVLGTGGSFTFIASGGTSASTPGMAGIAALLNQKMGTAQGNLNPRFISSPRTRARRHSTTSRSQQRRFRLHARGAEHVQQLDAGTVRPQRRTHGLHGRRRL